VWLHNGTSQNGTLQNGTLQNDTLHNGTLQNECCNKTVHISQLYVTKWYGYKTVTVTKGYVLQNGTLQNVRDAKWYVTKGELQETVL
jgi:hypothetical protein